ncbi:invasion protein [Escherichia coli]|nr:invasion protein [Escherichia coli]
MTWELILDGYSESSYSATPRFAAARLPWFSRLILPQVMSSRERGRC